MCLSAWHLVLCDVIDATCSRHRCHTTSCEGHDCCILPVLEVMSPFRQHKGYTHRKRSINLIMLFSREKRNGIKSRLELLSRHSQTARRWLLRTLRMCMLFARSRRESSYQSISIAATTTLAPFAPLTQCCLTGT